MSKQSNQRYRKEMEEKTFSDSSYKSDSYQDDFDDDYEDEFDDYADDYNDYED